MADFRVLDVILRLFPEVTDAVEEYRKVRSDREIRGIARSLANEEALFTQFARKISLLSTVTGSLDKGSLEKLGTGTTDFVLKGLNEMEDLLHKLKADLKNFSVSAAVLKEINKVRGTGSGPNWKTKTPFMARLEKLSALNSGLVGRLLDSQMPLPLPEESHPILTSEFFFHRDPAEPERAFSVAGTARDQEAGAVVLRCRCRKCNPRYDKLEPNDDGWDLEAFVLRKPADQGNDGPAEPSVSRSESMLLTSNEHAFPENKAISWVPLSLNKPGGRDDKPPQPESSSKVSMSLRDVMGHRSVLDYHQRMELCFRLSTSVLQLSSTPWVNESWTLDDFIAVLERENEATSLFVRQPSSPRQESVKKDPAWSIIAREPLLVRLGIHLTELALGRSLADIRREEPSTFRADDLEILDTDLLNLITIRRLLTLRIIAQRVSPDFQDVVSACINQQYRDRRHAKIQELHTTDNAFLDHATAAILTPLYHEVHKYHGPNRIKARKSGSSRAGTDRHSTSALHADRKGRRHVPTPAEEGHGLGGDSLPVSRPQGPVAAKRKDNSPTNLAADHTNQGPATVPDPQDNKVGQRGNLATQSKDPSTTSDCGQSAVLVPTLSEDTSDNPSKDTPQSDTTEADLIDDVSQCTAERLEKKPHAPKEDDDDASDYSYGTYTESTYSAFAWLHPPPMKLAADHPFLRFREVALQLILAHFQAWTAAGNGTGNSGQSAPANQGEPSSRKRKNGAGKGISQGYDDDDDDNDDTSQHSPNFPRKKQRGEKEATTFACPFLKKDPVAHKHCCIFVLSRIRDVKQHLRRRHQMPIYCPRCNRTFRTRTTETTMSFTPAALYAPESQTALQSGKRKHFRRRRRQASLRKPNGSVSSKFSSQTKRSCHRALSWTWRAQSFALRSCTKNLSSNRAHGYSGIS